MNNQESMCDLVREAARGDAQAFQTLYLRTRQKAYFVALSITKNEHDAQDILQDSYLKVYQSIGQLAQPESFQAWLNRIVANKSKNYLAKVNPRAFADYDDENTMNWQEETNADFLPDERLDQKEAKALVAKLVQDLPEDQRLVVLLHYFSDMEVAEIAQSLNVPEGTVKSRLSRARGKLAEMLRRAQNKGITLFAATPLPLLAYFIKQLGEPLQEAADRLPPLVLGGAGAAATAKAATAKRASGTVKAKALAATATTVVVLGGVIGGVAAYRKTQSKPGPINATTNTNVLIINTPAQTSAWEAPSFIPPQGTAAQTPWVSPPNTAAITFPNAAPVAPSAGAQAGRTKTTASQKTSTSAQATEESTGAADTTTQPANTVPSSTAPTTPATTNQTTTKTTTTRTLPTFKPWDAGGRTVPTVPTRTTVFSTTTALATTKPLPLVISFEYDTVNKRILRYTGTQTHVTVPATLGGVPMQHLWEGAFAGTAVERVEIAQGIDCIRESAFANCTRLKEVHVPDSVEWVLDGAFDGCPADLVLICKEGSAADNFAKTNGINVRYN
ncbi:MAG: sigma-70 family RNA polymerase sigma factor [Oscillospiraceae bacterium]|nr:sigma-70 family RNA polymerase sigma factor [Oscillospiraceae bacterium]